MTRVLGVDGCRAGWLALALELESGALEAVIAERWQALPQAAQTGASAAPWPGAALVAVDMPIGLAEAGPRACDRAARALLPPGRKASVFAPPRRPMLACADWTAAQALGRAREGCGLSRQAWNIAPKIRELDEALAPVDQDRVREVHPELVFHRLNGWRPLLPKRSAEGQRQRLVLLQQAGLVGLEPWLDHFPRRLAARDDVIDAAACALAAKRILQGQGKRLPFGEAPRDARGLRMEIWY